MHGTIQAYAFQRSYQPALAFTPQPPATDGYKSRISSPGSGMRGTSGSRPLANIQNFMSNRFTALSLDRSNIGELRSKEPHILEAKMEIARVQFEEVNWEPYKTQLPGMECKTGDIPPSKVPAVQIKAHIDAKPESIYPTMLDQLGEYANWLPIIKSMTVVDSPSANEHILTIETHGKLGIGAKSALAEATFFVTKDGRTQVRIAQIPPDDARYEQYPKLSNGRMKNFETFMEFVPSGANRDSVELCYENHTDPNIPRVPKWMVMKESMNNHTTFMAKCTATLVNSPNNR